MDNALATVAGAFQNLGENAESEQGLQNCIRKRPMTTRRFYARPKNFSADTVSLDESETRHLRDVLRLKAGDNVNVFDGIGNEFECRIASIDKRSSQLSIVSKVDPTAPESNLDLTICASILKGEKTDFAVQKLVELGVNKFVPMLSARCDVKIKDTAKRVDRWRKIAFEAAKQCGRAKLMSIGEVENFIELLQNHTIDLQKPARSKGENTSQFVLFSERDGETFNIESTPTSLTAFLGPEGGWDDAELNLAKKLQIPIFTLHGRIMKADTAAIAISAVLQHRFGDLN
jgi:16S rRNA (uracil1498-N3)-methyltransferase